MYKGLLTHSLLCSEFVELTLNRKKWLKKRERPTPNATDLDVDLLKEKIEWFFKDIVNIFGHFKTDHLRLRS